MVEGKWAWDDDDGPLGVYTSYDVVADSVEEGLRLLKRFEPQEVRDSVRVEGCEDIEARPDEPKGVYRVTGYNLFPLEGDDESG